MLSLQATRINGSKLDAPEANRFATDCYASLSEKVFYISVAEVEAIVKPYGVTYGIWWEPVAFVCSRLPILANTVA